MITIDPKKLPHKIFSGYLYSDERICTLIEASAAMFRFLAAMAERPNAPAAQDIIALLKHHGIEIGEGQT